MSSKRELHMASVSSTDRPSKRQRRESSSPAPILSRYEEESVGCPICLEDLSQDTSAITTTRCGHKFCISCLDKWLNSYRANGQPATCPSCRTQLRGGQPASFWDDRALLEQYLIHRDAQDRAAADQNAVMEEHEEEDIKEDEADEGEESDDGEERFDETDSDEDNEEEMGVIFNSFPIHAPQRHDSESRYSSDPELDRVVKSVGSFLHSFLEGL